MRELDVLGLDLNFHIIYNAVFCIIFFLQTGCAVSFTCGTVICEIIFYYVIDWLIARLFMPIGM